VFHFHFLTVGIRSEFVPCYIAKRARESARTTGGEEGNEGEPEGNESFIVARRAVSGVVAKELAL